MKVTSNIRTFVQALSPQAVAFLVCRAGNASDQSLALTATRLVHSRMHLTYSTTQELAAIVNGYAAAINH